MDRVYLLKYGLAGQVGRFAAHPEATYGRGAEVVIRSWRGVELAEVLIEASHLKPDADDAAPVAGLARVLRAATADDLRRAEAARAERDRQFAACAGVFRDGTWPIDLIDVEPLLDERRTVLHYLGPHKLDTAGLLAAFRTRCGLDVMFQPVGREAEAEPAEPLEEPEPEGHGCGSCSSSGGGCGTSGGCGSCGVRKLMNARR